MSNIFEIEKDLLELYDELEENGGEVTPELEDKLTITQEEFTRKVRGYTNIIKSLQSDMSSIKEEQARLKTLYEKKDKTVNKLKEIIIDAIDVFGDTKKSGVKYLDYGTGEVSVRKSEAVEINDDLVSYVGTALTKLVTYNKECNMLDVNDCVPFSHIIEDISKNTDLGAGGDDLKHIDVKLEVSVPLADIDNEKGYPVLKEIAKYSDNYKLSASVSKSALKPELKENGACAPNLAKLVQNESLIIK